MINQYKQDLQNGKYELHEYDACRYAADKTKFAKEWLLSKREVNIDDPHNVVDLICHEKIALINAPFCELEKRMMWADKICAYECLRKIGMSDLAVPYACIKYCTHVDEHIFECMSENCAYIIKTNHGSGWNIKYIPGKTDKKRCLEKLNFWLRQNYAYISGYEVQYKWIKPGIVIQKLLNDTPLDWSFWCIDGQIGGVGLTKKLGKNFEDYVAFVDENGEKPKWFIGMPPAMMKLNNKQKTILERMKPIVKKLANGFKFVRVDLYCVNDKIYFGEMTFTPCSGVLDVSYT